MSQVDLSQLVQSTNYAVSQAKAAYAVAAQMKEAHAADRNQLLGALQASQQNASQLLDAITRLNVSSSCGNPLIQRIENIPGRRVPFDLIVDIAIPANQSGSVQGTITISQEGPFVAVSRMATLISALTYQVIDDNGVAASFNGRSFGRYRPIHSAWDLNDGQPHVDVGQIVAFPGTGAPSITAPSNTASFRSMEGDFRILMKNAGSSFPRSNLEVPSTWWTKSINEPWELGALDFFERGEVLTLDILPMHPNNPNFGNVSANNPLNPLWPFLGSQFDAVEGINDAARAAYTGTFDPVTRNPAAIMTIGWHGYRIVQAPGVGPF